MRVAIIFSETVDKLAGSAISILNRINGINHEGEVVLNVYQIQLYSGRIASFIRREAYLKERKPCCKVHGINITKIWVKMPLSITILRRMFGFSLERQIKKRLSKYVSREFLNYDLVSAHSTLAGTFALNITQQHNVPYCVTWHGSDIHTAPLNNEHVRNLTIDILENAQQNIFVSNALRQKAMSLCSNITSKVIYNGVSSMFYRQNDLAKVNSRLKHCVNNKRVVAYCGNLFPVKNVMILPEIFSCVSRLTNQDIEYWIIGDGELRKPLLEALDDIKYRYFGYVQHNDVVELMNCIDVLVLPSINEGLPLVTLEALACGVNVVGSRVGGIPEAIGEENTFLLDENFVKNISKRIVFFLNNICHQQLDISKFSWKNAARQEIEIYKEILKLDKKITCQ